VVLLLIPPLPVAGVAVAIRVAVFVADRGKLGTLGQVWSISKNFLVSDTLALVLLAERIATREATPSNEAQSYQKNHQKDENSQRKSNIEGDVTGRGC
jgi:ribosomal protein L9